MGKKKSKKKPPITLGDYWAMNEKKENQPKLEYCYVSFTKQNGFDKEEISIDCKLKEGENTISYSISTDGWTINDVYEIQELIDRVNQMIG